MQMVANIYEIDTIIKRTGLISFICFWLCPNPSLLIHGASDQKLKKYSQLSLLAPESLFLGDI